MALRDTKGRPLVAVTGMGVVTSLGQGKDDTWAALTAGQSGIHRIERATLRMAAAPSRVLASAADGSEARLKICSYQRRPSVACPRISQKNSNAHAMTEASAARPRSMSQASAAR